MIGKSDHEQRLRSEREAIREEIQNEAILRLAERGVKQVDIAYGFAISQARVSQIINEAQ